MSCSHTYLKRPHPIIATYAIHLLLFIPQVWAAPHSINLVRRDGSTNASKIAVRPLIRLTFISLASSLKRPHPLGSHHSFTRFPRRLSHNLL